MKIPSALALLDWPSRRFLVSTFGMQLAAWSFGGMALLDFQLPLLQPVFCFLYYSFVPGFLVLRILRIHRIGIPNSFVYALGLSLCLQMFVGCLANFVLPVLSVASPMSTLPLAACWALVGMGLWITCFLRDRDWVPPTAGPRVEVGLACTSYIALPPILAMIGTYFENYLGTNVVLLLMLAVVASFPVVLAITKFVPESLFPAAVFSISLALVYHSSLISPNLWGWDVFSEYYLANSVLVSGLWNPALPFNVNAMLGTVILAPSYSIETGMSLTWVFKAMYPFLFAFLPTTLYLCFRRQLTPRLAFASAFFFAALFVFYVEMIFLPRQQVAELFLGLIALLLVEKELSPTARTLLATAFSIGIVVSHYGVTYLFLGSLLAAFLIVRLAGRGRPHQHALMVRPAFIILSATFAISWYVFVSSSTNFSTLIRLGSYIQAHFFTDFLNPQTSQPVSIVLAGTSSPLHSLAGVLYLIAQLLIGLGLVSHATGRSRVKLNSEFGAMAGASFLVLVASVLVPYFASALNTSRLYHYSLIFLAPFLPIGASTLTEVLGRSVRIRATRKHTGVRIPATALFVFVAVFLLFNSGAIYQIAMDHPTSISLDSQLDFPRYVAGEVDGAQWLAFNSANQSIFTDGYRLQIFRQFGVNTGLLPPNIGGIQSGAFIYLGKYNIEHNSVVIIRLEGASQSEVAVPLDPSLLTRGKIFDDGDCQIWL